MNSHELTFSENETSKKQAILMNLELSLQINFFVIAKHLTKWVERQKKGNEYSKGNEYLKATGGTGQPESSVGLLILITKSTD